MDLNFLLRCALSLAIAGALSRVLRPGGRARGGLALLVTWAICSGLLAFFADDIEGTPQHGSGIVHLVLAFIAFTAIAIGAILISASLMSDPAWRPAASVLLATSVAGAVALHTAQILHDLQPARHTREHPHTTKHTNPTPTATSRGHGFRRLAPPGTMEAAK
jgi:uncharacterized membrane protein